MKIKLSHFFCGLLFVLAVQVGAGNLSSEQSTELDSLKRVLSRTKSDTARIRLLYAIGIKSDISRLSYWDSLLADAQLHYPKYETQILTIKRHIYYKEGNAQKAIDMLLMGLVLAEKHQNNNEMISFIRDVTYLYIEQADRKNSLYYLYRWIKIPEVLNNKKNEFDFYSAMAFFYWSSGETKKALQIHFKCLEIAKELRYYNGIVSALVDIGSAYHTLNQDKKASSFYLQSLPYVPKLKEFPMAIYHIYNSVSAAYLFTKKYDSAYYYALKGNEKAIELNNKRMIISAKLCIAEIKHATGENKQAEKLAMQCLTMSKLSNFIVELPLLYHLLERIYTKTGRYKKALNVYKLNIAIRDSLSNEQVRKQAMEKEFAYTYEKKEQAYNILAQKNQIQTLQLEQNRFMMAGFVALLLAIIAIAYLYYKQNKFRIEHTKILMEQKLLLSQMNPHFIFNSLNSIQQLIMKGQNTQAEVYLSKFSKLIRELLENSTRENLTVQEEIEMLQVYLEMESLRFSGSFKYDILVDNTIDITHAAIPHLMVQPFVENAIWHGLLPKPNDRYLQIKFAYHTNQSIQCTVYDNGVGRTASAQKQPLLNKKSLAMDLIKKRIGVMNQSNAQKGNITVIDKKDAAGNSLGTTIVLVLPILNV